MSMSVNFLAILISLAMMLTGVGGEGQPAEAAKTLLVHNISVTFNGESAELAPALRLGAYTNGEKAVYDLSVELNGEKLFPMQLGVSDEGLKALFAKSDVAVGVSADALNALSEQATQMLESMTAGDEENAEVMQFIMNEFIPAYAGLFEAVKDKDFVEQLQAKANAIFDEVIDRGEGTPVTEMIEGEEYALIEYTYEINADQLAQLADAVYSSEERLNNFYVALFKLYDMMPEESGLKGMHSFADVFSKMGINMNMAVEEKLSDDRTIDIMDAVLTMDMNAIVQNSIAAAEAAGEAEEVEVPEDIPPMVFTIHSSQIGDVKDAEVDFDYEIAEENMGVTMNMTAHGEGMTTGTVDFDMAIAQNGEDVGSVNMNMAFDSDEATGDSTYALVYGIDAEDQVDMDFNLAGTTTAAGTSQNSVSLSVLADDVDVDVSFDVDVVADAIEDQVNGHETALTLNDLSDEALNALGEDEAFQAALMQVVGSLSADGQKLMADESVQQLITLVSSLSFDQAEVDYSDDSFEGEDAADYGDGEIEDDGVLGYEVPQFTWLPEGWTAEEPEVDTAYDWVNMNINNAEGNSCVYVTFYEDAEDNTINYVVGGDGEIEAVDGREISLNDFGDGNISVTMHEANLYGNMMFYGEELDVETIGRIVAGIQF